MPHHPSDNPSATYTTLVSITQPDSPEQIKEWLDIALVSAAHDISTAIYISTQNATALQANPKPDIEQTWNMIGEFKVPIFSESCITLFSCHSQSASLDTLTSLAKHHFSF
ncbi:hypothetical protein [Ostreibacterium oceani]|uniref:Uncharacterized protein n=1 Tax=Ostreibacterium oceani TaxID=2654998 RepID=A0A6N7EXR7_9GAMM|nr:hypothetical protein [Ostreibacterium oceani]MPV86179.1 hypothetical protein [Ostreibacterium oceani]